MNLLEALSIAGRAIWAHKLRSFLTLLGTIVAVASVIFVVSLIEGFNRYVAEKIADMGSNAFVVTRYGIITSLKEFKEKEKYNHWLTLDELEAIRTDAHWVREASARTGRHTDLKAGNRDMKNVRVDGVSSNFLDVDTTKVGQGRFFSSMDENARANVAFIGTDVARELYPNLDPLNQEIKIDGRPFRIIGVAEEIGTVFGQPQDSFVLLPMMTYVKSYGGIDTMSVQVSAVSGEHMQDAVDEVRMKIRRKRHLAFDAKDSFDIITPDAINNLREQIFGTISVVTLGVTSIALVVGGIVIMNIMLVSVTERTREIGVRKALGARRNDILKQFLAESTLLSLLGGAIGVLVALGLSEIFTAVLSVPTSLPVLWTVIALVTSASIGLFFGIYPAWRAAGLDPIVALRAD